MIKRGVTLVELLVVGAIAITLVGLFVAAMSNAPQATGSASLEPPQTSLLHTVMHDGHKWVLSFSYANAEVQATHFVHHPDCRCRTVEVER